MPAASGRSPFSALLALTALATLLLSAAACQSSLPIGAAAPEPRAEPVLMPGPISPAREARAAELLARAQDAFGQGEYEEARRLAAAIVSDFAAAPVSGRALRLLATASLRAERYEAADAAAARYLALLRPGDPRATELRLVQGEARLGLDDPRGALDVLIRIDASASGPTLLERARVLAREAARRAGPGPLRAVLAGAPGHAALTALLHAWYARALFVAGDRAGAAEEARRALAAGAATPDSVLAEGILSGKLPGEPRTPPTVRIGSVLPMSGPPALADVATAIEEGIEVAAAMRDRELKVEVKAADDRGDPSLAAERTSELETAGVVGIVGPLESSNLQAAARARARGIPLISPTAVDIPAGAPAILSLSGPDPAAATSMARYAVRAGLVRVAVVHSEVPESEQEARAFEDAYASLGGELAGEYSYPAGATFFGDQLAAAAEALRGAEIRALGLGPDDTLHVEELQPVGIFLPVPPEDLETLAPQVTFFGLDTLGIQVLGTGSWTDPDVLASVDSRHTNGVVATAPEGAGPGAPGYERFKAAYEEHFQRSLRSSLAALGYDAALILLEPVRRGARTPGSVRAGLARIRDVEGATGIFSVLDGRLVRRHRVVRIDHRTFIPIG